MLCVLDGCVVVKLSTIYDVGVYESLLTDNAFCPYVLTVCDFVLGVFKCEFVRCCLNNLPVRNESVNCCLNIRFSAVYEFEVNDALVYAWSGLLTTVEVNC